MRNRKPSVTVELGQVVATPGALDALAHAGVQPMDLLRRHQSGDWGVVSAGDARLNDRAAKTGDERILSVYVLTSSEKVWVITEADRSSTCLLLPSEY